MEKIEQLFEMIPGGTLEKVSKEYNIDKDVLGKALGKLGTELSTDTNWLEMGKNLLDLDGDGEIVDDLPKILGFFVIIKGLLGLTKKNNK